MTKKTYIPPMADEVMMIAPSLICTSNIDPSQGLGTEDIGNSGNIIEWQ